MKATAPQDLSRRRFLGQASCAAMSSVSVVNTLLHLNLAARVAAQPAPTDRRTLVCVYLGGGMDSFNLLMPRDTTRHNIYRATRSELAIPLTGTRAMLSLNQDGGDGQLYGIHPSCASIQELFNGLGGDASKRRAAFATNVGTLIQPTTLAQYNNETVPLPRALFSHSDQSDQWMTSVPQGMIQATGWAGRAADLLHSTSNSGGVSMNMSFAGNNLWQVGGTTNQFVVSTDGALVFTEPAGNLPATHPFALKNSAHESILQQTYSNLMQLSYASLTKDSLALQRSFEAAFNGYDTSAIDALFSDNYYGTNMLAVAKSIALREQLGLTRQTIFVNFGGWDHHGELLNSQVEMFGEMMPALAGFQKALELLGLQDSVITYTATEFGRTLRSNGQGTDHGWGNNSLIFGGPVQGGRIYGTFPDLTLDGPDDVGYGGRLLPSTSVDELFAEMLRWFGVSSTDLATVLPNITNFYDPYATTLPLGFVKNGMWS